MTIARRWVAETTLSTWTVSEAWADALKPGRRGRAAATAGAARGRGIRSGAQAGLGAAANLWPGKQACERSLPSPSSVLQGQPRSRASRRPARAMDGKSCAEGNRFMKAVPPPLTVPGRPLRSRSPGLGPHRLTSARFCVGPGRRGAPLADSRARGPPPCSCFPPDARPPLPESTLVVPATEQEGGCVGGGTWLPAGAVAVLGVFS